MANMLGKIQHYVKSFSSKKNGNSESPREERERVKYTSRKPEKLFDAVRWSFEQLETARKNHTSLVKQFVGARYGHKGSKYKSEPDAPEIIINKINQMVITYMHLLASGTPQALVETKRKDLKSFSKTLQEALNNKLIEVRLAETIRRCVQNALFSIGIAKTGIADGGKEYEVDGQFYDAGSEFTRPVSINNFVIDMQAENDEEIEYIGDRFLRPLSWVKKLKKSATKTDERVELRPEERVSGIAEEPDKRLQEKVWVWEVYLPKENVVILFQMGDEEPLKIIEWNGPEYGPYETLQFYTVPDEPIGISPVETQYPMHKHENNLVRKVLNQAHRSKKIGQVARGDNGDAETIKNAKDGDLVALQSQQPVKEYPYGGPDMALHNLSIWLDTMFDGLGGNLSLLSGMGPQSETLGQDEILRETANVRVNSMIQSVVTFVERIVYRHAWYLWAAQVEPIDLQRKISGTSVVIPATFDPEEREGDFLEYNFTINPYSLRKYTPNERLKELFTMWNQFVIPSAELAMQAGWVPAFEEFGRKVMELADMDFELLFTPVDPTRPEKEEPGGASIPPRFKMSVTQNERISRPGHTEAGNRNALLASNAAMSQPQTRQAG